MENCPVKCETQTDVILYLTFKMKERTPMKSMFLLTIITIEVSNLWIFWTDMVILQMIVVTFVPFLFSQVGLQDGWCKGTGR